MLVAAIVIYLVFAFFLGPLWPLEGFAKGGLFGKLLVIGWAFLLISGLSE